MIVSSPPPLSLRWTGARPRVLMVISRYYAAIAAQLEAGARAVLDQAKADVVVFEAMGALEMPVLVQTLLRDARSAGRAYDAVIALGCVIRGETYHFEIVAGESARGLMNVGLEEGLPVGQGILTVETMEQAEERADPSRLDKGGAAALAALLVLQAKDEHALRLRARMG